MKSRLKNLLIGIAIAVVLAGLTVGFALWCGRSYARVSLDTTYYFLTQPCEEATAASVTTQVYLSGGAGYYLEQSGESVVVLSCYFNEKDALSVQKNMTLKGIETDLLALSAPDFELNGSAADEKERIVANAESVDQIAKIIYETANGLERSSLSQEEARSVVRSAAAALGGLQSMNEGDYYRLWNNCLKRAERQAKELCEGILFAKDLRHLQIDLCLTALSIHDYL